MDSFAWESSQNLTNTSTLWSNNHHHNQDLDQETLLMSSNSSSSALHIPTILDHHQLQHLQESHILMNPNNQINSEMAHQHWGGKNLGPFLLNSLINSAFMADDQQGANKARSIDSLDCLFSTTNSNSGEDQDDDAINSTIFSDSRKSNLWNFETGSASTTTAVSSESETTNNAARPNKRRRGGDVDQSDHQLKIYSEYSQQFDFLQTDLPTQGGGFKLISDDPPKSKKLKSISSSDQKSTTTNINFQQPTSSSISNSSTDHEPDPEVIAQMKEMIYRAAAFRPVNLGLDIVEIPKRKNVKISKDPQTVAARQRRERISERIRVLQKLVPGGSKMDTASMLDEAANYLKFLRSQVKALENLGKNIDSLSGCVSPTSFAFSFNPSFPMQTHHLNPNHVIHQPPN